MIRTYPHSVNHTAKIILLFLVLGVYIKSSDATGSCKCTKSNGVKKTEEEARAAASCTLVNSCELGNMCNAVKQPCVLEPEGITCTVKDNGKFKCVPSCSGRNNRACINDPNYVASSIGDPHFSGFDGTKFDFHGENGRKYIVYGKQKGDLLIAKVRATPELFYGVNKTYFSEFALQPIGSTARIHVYLRRYQLSHAWSLVTEIDGRQVTGNLSDHNVDINFKKGEDSVIINTKQSTFVVSGISLKSRYRRHVDFQVLLKNGAEKKDYFTGVLGMTLSRRLGSAVHEDVHMKNPYLFEMEMRKHYQVSLMFPNHGKMDRLYTMAVVRKQKGQKSVKASERQRSSRKHKIFKGVYVEPHVWD